VFLPIGDTPNPPGFRAWVTWGLIAVNTAIFLVVSLPLSARGVDPRDPALLEYVRTLAPELSSRAELAEVLRSVTAYDLLVFEHGYRPGSPEVADLVTSMFLHGGWLHLLGNMLFLWIFGNNVEHRMGRLAYVVAYVGTGVVATLSFAWLAGDSQIPMIGASGAISGVLGLYFVAFPRNKVKVFVFLFPILFDVILVSSRLVLGFYVVIDNLLPLFLGAESGVAYGAHLGGFAGGAGLAFAWRTFSWRLPGVGGAWRWGREPGRSEGAVEHVEVLREAVASGDRELTLNGLRHLQLGELRRLTTDEGLQVAEWLLEVEELGAAERVLRQVLGAREVSPAELARGLVTLGLIRLLSGQPASGYQYLKRVLELDADAEASRRARAALEQVPLSRRLWG
jgi:membrane associated rhomboid family serine protease